MQYRFDRAIATFLTVTIAACSNSFAGSRPGLGLLPAADQSSLIVPPRACAWKIVPTINLGSSSSFTGVSGSSTSDVWAVGRYFTSSAGPLTLAEHWSGKSWAVVATPDPGPYGDNLFGVATLSTKDAWAVGYATLSGSTSPALILHWDGKVWKQYAAPAVPSGDAATLYSITAYSTKDIWAMGSLGATSSPNPPPYSVHFDGRKWKAVPIPNPGKYGSAVDGVAMSGPDDVWTTGGTYTSSSYNSFVTLTEHWNGKKWSVVKSPNANSNDNVFNAAVAVAPKDAWAIGDYYTGTSFDTLTEHWNGKKWSIVPSPNVANVSNGLYAATGLSSADVWAVGSTFSGSQSSTLTMKWSGKKWAIVKSPNLGAPDQFNAVTNMPKTTDLWAVGTTLTAGAHQTLAAGTGCGA
ncbi:MAG: hypothetical protein JO351_01135 [Candidatus Eremiobacteraeota bacterium]|nr:hypothetical protein [Candidatus Eremiobacteraeota bacterium]